MISQTRWLRSFKQSEESETKVWFSHCWLGQFENRNSFLSNSFASITLARHATICHCNQTSHWTSVENYVTENLATQLSVLLRRRKISSRCGDTFKQQSTLFGFFFFFIISSIVKRHRLFSVGVKAFVRCTGIINETQHFLWPCPMWPWNNDQSDMTKFGSI